jgi:hypothetical protein
MRGGAYPVLTWGWGSSDGLGGDASAGTGTTAGGAPGVLSWTGSTLELDATTRRLERGAPPVEDLERLGNPSGCGPVALRRAEREATGRGLGEAALAMPPRREIGEARLGIGVGGEPENQPQRRACGRERAPPVGVRRFAAWAKRDGKESAHRAGKLLWLTTGRGSVGLNSLGPRPKSSIGPNLHRFFCRWKLILWFGL